MSDGVLYTFASMQTAVDSYLIVRKNFPIRLKGCIFYFYGGQHSVRIFWVRGEKNLGKSFPRLAFYVVLKDEGEREIEKEKLEER